MGSLLVHLVGEDERDDIGIDLTLINQVYSVIGSKLAGDARSRDRVRSCDVHARAVSKDSWATSNHGLPPPGLGASSLAESHNAVAPSTPSGPSTSPNPERPW
jgi:hypothetical protein